jgi:hypothetical protein
VKAKEAAAAAASVAALVETRSNQVTESPVLQDAESWQAKAVNLAEAHLCQPQEGVSIVYDHTPIVEWVAAASLLKGKQRKGWLPKCWAHKPN